MIFLNEDGFEKLGGRFVLDRIQTQTPYGQQAKRSMAPFALVDREALEAHYQVIEELMLQIERHRYTFVELRNQFKKLKDLSGSLKRIEEDEPLSVPEIFEIKSMVLAMGEIESAMMALKWNIPSELVIKRLALVESLLDPEKQGVNTFYLYDAYSEALASIRRRIKDIDEEIRRIQKSKRLRLEDDLDIRIRPNGEITVSKESKALIEKLESCESLAYSAETYMNITFRVREDEAVVALQGKKEELIQDEDVESFKVREVLTAELKTSLEEIHANIEAIAKLDLYIAQSYFAAAFNCVRPEISDEPVLEIEDGRHPAVEERLRRESKIYKPVSVNIREGATCITGANMGGKTVTLKMTGLLVWMAQMGLFVPAESMRLNLRDFIFVSIGDEQDLDLGLSTFGAEIVKVSKAVELSSGKGLILIDELARGTNPKEGYAISKALIDTLKTRQSMTVITTHFDGLADAQDVKHLQVMGLGGVDFSKLKDRLDKGEASYSLGMEILHELMDYKLKEIHSPQEVPKDAVRIAHLMGLSADVLDKANEILSEFHRA